MAACAPFAGTTASDLDGGLGGDDASLTGDHGGSDGGIAPGNDASVAGDASAAGVPTFVQHAENRALAGSAVTATFMAPVNGKDAIVVAVGAQGNTAMPTITDSLGSVYTFVVGPATGPGGMTHWIAIAENVVAGTNVSVTAHYASSVQNILLYANEYAGVAVAFAYVAGNFGTGMSNTMDSATSGPITVPIGGLLLFGFVTSTTSTAGTGFTLRSALDNIVTEDRPITAPGTYYATGTPSGNWTALGAAFKGL
jgi:hypothetical protein